MEEIWKDIPGYEGLYKVSNYGKVYSEYSKRCLIPYITKTGYLRYTLVKDKTKTLCLAHRLVAQAFLPNPNNLPIVCHKVAVSNGGTNHVDNLYWGTEQDNQEDKIRDGNNAKKNKENFGKKVLQIDLKTGNIVKEYETVIEASKAMGSIYPSNISNVCCNRSKTAYGYFWKYKEEEEK